MNHNRDILHFAWRICCFALLLLFGSSLYAKEIYSLAAPIQVVQIDESLPCFEQVQGLGCEKQIYESKIGESTPHTPPKSVPLTPKPIQTYKSVMLSEAKHLALQDNKIPLQTAEIHKPTPTTLHTPPEPIQTHESVMLSEAKHLALQDNEIPLRYAKKDSPLSLKVQNNKTYESKINESTPHTPNPAPTQTKAEIHESAPIQLALNTQEDSLCHSKQSGESCTRESKSTQEIHNKIEGLPQNSGAIHWLDDRLHAIPYFTIQVGIGGVHTKHIAAQNAEISSSGIPTFSLGIGFMQQYYMMGFNLGYSLKLSYEIGVKSLGENTMSFRSPGGFAHLHIGYKWVLLHGGVGYEMLSVGQAFIPSNGERVLHRDDGMAYSGGLIFLLNRYHALNLEVRQSAIYGRTPRAIVHYEFRF